MTMHPFCAAVSPSSSPQGRNWQSSPASSSNTCGQAILRVINLHHCVGVRYSHFSITQASYCERVHSVQSKFSFLSKPPSKVSTVRLLLVFHRRLYTSDSTPVGDHQGTVQVDICVHGGSEQELVEDSALACSCFATQPHHTPSVTCTAKSNTVIIIMLLRAARCSSFKGKRTSAFTTGSR